MDTRDVVDLKDMGEFTSLLKSVNLSATTNNKCLYLLSVDHLPARIQE